MHVLDDLDQARMNCRSLWFSHMTQTVSQQVKNIILVFHRVIQALLLNSSIIVRKYL